MPNCRLIAVLAGLSVFVCVRAMLGVRRSAERRHWALHVARNEIRSTRIYICGRGRLHFCSPAARVSGVEKESFHV